MIGLGLFAPIVAVYGYLVIAVYFLVPLGLLQTPPRLKRH